MRCTRNYSAVWGQPWLTSSGTSTQWNTNFWILNMLPWMPRRRLSRGESQRMQFPLSTVHRIQQEGLKAVYESTTDYPTAQTQLRIIVAMSTPDVCCFVGLEHREGAQCDEKSCCRRQTAFICGIFRGKNHQRFASRFVEPLRSPLTMHNKSRRRLS